MRRVLLVLLGFGVFAGYGSAIASARWHARHHGGGGCESRSSRGYEREEGRAPAPAPAQQIFLIMPGAQAAPTASPQVITIPLPTAAAPVQGAPASP